MSPTHAVSLIAFALICGGFYLLLRLRRKNLLAAQQSGTQPLGVVRGIDLNQLRGAADVAANPPVMPPYLPRSLAETFRHSPE